MNHADTVDRRHFLAALSAGAIVAGSTPAAETPADRVGFGFSLYGMKSLTLAEALQLCRMVGYDCVELPVIKGWSGDSAGWTAATRRAFREQLVESRLRLSALMEDLHLPVDDARHRENLARLEAAAELSRELVPDGPRVIETICGGQPEAWERLRPQMESRLSDWARVAERTRTVVAIKPHVAGAMHRPEHAVALVRAIDSPWVRATYDFSHYELRGLDLAETLATLLPFTAFIHVKDSQGEAGPGKFRFLLPGDGRIDYVRYLTLLRERGYRGDVVVEVSGQIHNQPGYDPRQAARRSYDNLAPAFERARLRRG